MCGQSCMDNTSNGLNETNDSSITETTGESLSTAPLLLSSSKMFTEPFSLTTDFLPALYDSYSFIRVANFLFVTYRCIFIPIRPSLFSLSNWYMFLTWSVFTYNLIELHLIPIMLGSHNNANQLSTQFVTSVQITPAKIVLVDCIRAIHL